MSNDTETMAVIAQRHPALGFRPPPESVTAARDRLGDHPDWTLTRYLEACLRWLAEDPKSALAAATPWSTPRLTHERLAAALRVRIETGNITGRMPPNVEIAEHYGVSRNTVPEALAILVDQGLIADSAPRPGYDVVPRRGRRSRHRSASLR
jgi:hypothetical protein